MPKYELTPNVARLLTLGNPNDHQTEAIESSMQTEDIPSLINLLEDHDLRWESPEDSPDGYGAVYAWRAVGHLKAEAAIPALIGLLPDIDSEYDEWAQEELPEVFENIGPVCVPALVEFLQTPPVDGDVWGAATAIEGLQKIALRYPETRSTCIATLTALLEGYAEGDELYNSLIVMAASELKAFEMVPLIERAYAADRVDEGLLGDWEDFQVKVGLLEKRITPRRKLVWRSSLDDPLEEGLDEESEDVPDSSDWTPELRKQVKVDNKKAKNKRKQEKKSRKKNRKKK
jgi:hypothetical protein